MGQATEGAGSGDWDLCPIPLPCPKPKSLWLGEGCHSHLLLLGPPCPLTWISPRAILFLCLSSWIPAMCLRSVPKPHLASFRM